MTDWPFENLTPFCADLILADPPWRFALYNEETGAKKAAQAQYDCMTLDAIKALPVRDLAGKDCWLFLWATAPLLPEAIDVMRAWGFTYKTTQAWRKTTVNGKVRWGTGYICRSMHENLVIGSVGDPDFAKAMPSLFDGLAREHSRKPDEHYAMLEAFAPEARLVELFGRQSRPNWKVWGLEATKFDEAAE